MRLTVISHSCVVDTNQQFFAALEELGVVLQLIVPAEWRSDLTGELKPPTRWEELRVPLTRVPVTMPGSVPLHAYKSLLTRLYYQFQPDAIYVENESYAVSTFQGALANQLSVRRPFLFRNNQNIAKTYPFPFAQTERYVLRHAACANLVNEDAGRVLRAKGFKHRMAYMPYGIDPAFHRPHDARPLRAKLGLKGFVFGYMGRLVEEKGIRELLEAFARFHPEEEVSLLLIGDGPMREEVETRLGTEGMRGRAALVHAVEHRDVPPHLSAMDALVLPSRTTPTWREQFGRVIIEAVACGVPVIGSDSGEVPRLIERLGAGLTVSEGDATALHAAMRKLMADTNLYDALRERGRVEVEEQFSHEALAYRFRQLLESIVADGRRGRGRAETMPAWVEDEKP